MIFTPRARVIFGVVATPHRQRQWNSRGVAVRTDEAFSALFRLCGWSLHRISTTLYVAGGLRVFAVGRAIVFFYQIADNVAYRKAAKALVAGQKMRQEITGENAMQEGWRQGFEVFGL